jgi:hypothetical protein
VFASFPGALLIATSERAGGQGARAGVHGGPGG